MLLKILFTCRQTLSVCVFGLNNNNNDYYYHYYYYY